MSRRVLLVEDEPDVIEAVTKRLEGFEVRAVRTIESALVELGRNEYGLVLLDKCLAGEDATQALTSAGHCESYVLDANRRTGDSRPEPVVYGAGQSPIGIDSLRLICREPATNVDRDEGDVARLAVAIANAFAGEPSVGLAAAILNDVCVATGSRYAAFLARPAEGVRILCEAGDGSRLALPHSVAGREASACVTSSESPEGTWICVSSGPQFALVVLAGRDATAAHALVAQLGQPLAKLLERCYGVRAGGGGAVVASAIESLVHDTRNYVTGLALSLEALRGKERDASRRSHGGALIGMQLDALADICREYARIETVGALDGLGPDSRETVRAYARVLDRFGVGVSNVEIDGRFALAPASDGVLARTLVALALELAQLRATGVSIECRMRDTVATVGLRFSATRKWMLNTCLARMREVCELVNGRGGCATVSGAEGAGEVSIEFISRDLAQDLKTQK